MWLGKKESEVEIQRASGMLRVTVKPKRNPILLFVEVGVIAAFVYLKWNRLPAMFQRDPIYWTLLGLGVVTSLWFQLSGSEEIEFDGQRQLLVIRRSLLGWPRTWEYVFPDICALGRREPTDNNPDGLTCRWNGRTITFAKGISSEQADDVLSELQQALPDAAHGLMAGGDPFGKHFIALNLQ